MIRKYIALAATVALALSSGAAAQTPVDEAAANRVRAHVEFLADDLLEGRMTGERGYDIAATYVASRFRALGLQPGGENGGWFQQVPFRRAFEARPTTAALVTGNGRAALVLGEDINIPPSLIERDRNIENELVFVGYGISDPRLGIDDYRGLDVRGKTVVVLGGTPAGLPTEIAAHLSATKTDMAAAKGAIGYISLSSKPHKPKLTPARQAPVDWVDAAGKAGSVAPGLRFTAAISEPLAERLFAGAPTSLAEVRRQAGRSGNRPAGFALRPRLALEAQARWQEFKSPEVIGILPGIDPQLKQEYVVLMGHLDHHGLNRNAKPGEDAIYNGALDNAAGVATLLEAAREFVDSGQPPRRSVMFIAHTGEELGLLGADYFARHPTVPIENIVGGVDLDMPVPLYDFTDVVAFGAEHSTVARTVGQAARQLGMTVSPDPMPEQSIFIRSDHYRFVQQGVPAILLFTGYANGGKAKWDHFFANIYHTPKDDLSQPINWNAAARYAKLNYLISRGLADADTRPLWYRGDYFADLYAPNQPRAEK